MTIAPRHRRARAYAPRRPLRRLSTAALHLAARAARPEVPAVTGGWRWVVLTLVIAMAGDVGGYFGGRYYGRRKLMPTVSPGKTVEGTLAAFGANVAGAVFCKLAFFHGLDWPEVVGLGLATGSLAQVGDLCESMLSGPMAPRILVGSSPGMAVSSIALIVSFSRLPRLLLCEVLLPTLTHSRKDAAHGEFHSRRRHRSRFVDLRARARALRGREVVGRNGHAVLARLGPRLFGWRRGETEYAISAVPLGGYVKMLGEDPEEDVPSYEAARAFSAQSLLKRAAIVVAGPGMNLVTAFVAFTLVFALFGAGSPTEAPKIGGVMEGMPAAKAGLERGDTVLTIEGKAIATWEQLSETVRASGGAVLHLSIRRASGAVEELVVTPSRNLTARRSVRRSAKPT